jgi:hypothetical protein
MNPVVALVLMLSLETQPPSPAAPEVSGLIATRVRFDGKARDKMALAVLDLLETCRHSAPATEADWLDALAHCHVKVRYPAPAREVAVSGAAKIAVVEAVVVFPLASKGRIVVRSGERYAYFSKFAPSGPLPGRELRHFEELLREARVAD